VTWLPIMAGPADARCVDSRKDLVPSGIPALPVPAWTAPSAYRATKHCRKTRSSHEVLLLAQPRGDAYPVRHVAGRLRSLGTTSPRHPLMPYLQEQTTMTTELDLAVINDYMRDAATRAVADAIRAQSGRLVVRDDPREPELHLLDRPLSVLERRAYTDVHPVPIERPDEPLGWWARYWHRVAIALGAVTVVGLLVWGILALIGMLVSATTRAVTSAAPSLGGLLLLLLLVAFLCSRGGGGRSFSGTFQGKLH
jgi:hypothetical protein